MFWKKKVEIPDRWYSVTATFSAKSGKEAEDVMEKIAYAACGGDKNGMIHICNRASAVTMKPLEEFDD